MYDFSGLTLGNYKAWPGRCHWTRFPAHPRCGAQPRPQHLGTCGLVSGSLASHACHIYKSLYLRPGAEVFFRCLCWDFLLEGGGRTMQTLFPTVTVPSTFPLLVPAAIPQPKGRPLPKSCWSLLFRAPSTVTKPHICAEPPDPPLPCCFIGKMSESGYSLGLASYFS